MYIFSNSPIIFATIDLAMKSDLLKYIRNDYTYKSFREVLIDEVHDILVSCKFQNCMQSV